MVGGKKILVKGVYIGRGLYEERGGGGRGASVVVCKHVKTFFYNSFSWLFRMVPHRKVIWKVE